MAERLALLGDIHANSAALGAVLAAIREAGLDDGACTGDLVMRGDDPETCVTAIRESGWPCVMGNTDRKVAVRPRRDPGHPKARRVGSRAWSSNELSPESTEYLVALPLMVRLTLAGATIVLMHGGPDDPRDAIGARTSDRPSSWPAWRPTSGRPTASSAVTPTAPWSGRRRDALSFNPGSVGEAIDGDRRPRWAWLEARGAGLRAHLERVPAELRDHPPALAGPQAEPIRRRSARPRSRDTPQSAAPPTTRNGPTSTSAPSSQAAASASRPPARDNGPPKRPALVAGGGGRSVVSVRRSVARSTRSSVAARAARARPSTASARARSAAIAASPLGRRLGPQVGHLGLEARHRVRLPSSRAVRSTMSALWPVTVPSRPNAASASCARSTGTRKTSRFVPSAPFGTE